ncbi:MAG: hypothetical protein GTN70_08590 [Deltaproteobacteria bacterium]|nr:hypothetical protein [Deltaproteobacteria bacterium]NIS77832.1 hypothetical protein [Deltaproteobacteria bacterium]
MELEIERYFKRFPLIIAHRGAPKVAAENSARAIQAAVDFRADMIEVDLRTTGDGEIVLFHDEDTSRMAGVKKVVGESTLAELEGLTLPGGESIIGLREALKIVGGKIPLNLELKSEGSGRALAAYLDANPCDGLIIVSSFKAAELKEFREAAPDIPTSALVRNPSRRDIESARQGRCLSINVNSRHVKGWMAQQSMASGIALFVYTVDEEEVFHHLARMGISGFFTNEPEKLLRFREAL